MGLGTGVLVLLLATVRSENVWIPCGWYDVPKLRVIKLELTVYACIQMYLYLHTYIHLASDLALGKKNNRGLPPIFQTSSPIEYGSTAFKEKANSD